MTVLQPRSLRPTMASQQEMAAAGGLWRVEHSADRADARERNVRALDIFGAAESELRDLWDETGDGVWEAETRALRDCIDASARYQLDDAHRRFVVWDSVPTLRNEL